MHKISVPYGTQGKIAAQVGVSVRTVQSALAFATEGEQPDLIRDTAMKYYNGVVVKRPMNFSKRKPR